MTFPDARTRIVGVVGAPVGHSLSPAIHNAALRHDGINAVYLAFEVAPARLAAAVAGLRVSGALGLNVTVPHKPAALRLADAVDSTAERVGAANTLVFGAEGIRAHNTDVAGFSRAFGDMVGPPSALRCVLLGAGGAARAAAWALSDAGARVVIANRTAPRAEALAAGLAAPVQTVAWEAVGEAVQTADVVVNATSVGLNAEETPLDARALARAAAGGCRAVVDLVYRPGETLLVRQARAAGIPATDGLAALVWQAAEAYTLLTGSPAPERVMFEAAWSAAGRSGHTARRVGGVPWV